MASAGMAAAASSERIQQQNERAAVGKMVAAGRARAGARWFYWIAGLSFVNSLVVISGGSLHFVVGLGITSIVDAAAKRVAGAGTFLDVLINGSVAAVFALLECSLAKRRNGRFCLGWPFTPRTRSFC